MKKKKLVKFNAELKRFSKNGEKTGWTYIDIPAKTAEMLQPGNRKGFRVKGKLDDHIIKGVSLLPMGNGNFIMPVNATMRKGIKKVAGGKVSVTLEIDSKEYTLNKELMICMKDDPVALEYFQSLTRSHQNYFSKWVDSAKTNETKAKRIARILNAMARKMDYGQMLREKDHPIQL
jgi:hypothetical protein